MLIQGYVAFIARNPIYLNISDSVMHDRFGFWPNITGFWGFATAVLPVNSLVRANEFAQIASIGYSFKVTALASHSYASCDATSMYAMTNVQLASGTEFFWSPDLTSASTITVTSTPLVDPISSAVMIPDGCWRVDASRTWIPSMALWFEIALMVVSVAMRLYFSRHTLNLERYVLRDQAGRNSINHTDSNLKSYVESKRNVNTLDVVSSDM